jgi:hypothetical protein
LNATIASKTTQPRPTRCSHGSPTRARRKQCQEIRRQGRGLPCNPQLVRRIKVLSRRFPPPRTLPSLRYAVLGITAFMPSWKLCRADAIIVPVLHARTTPSYRFLGAVLLLFFVLVWVNSTFCSNCFPLERSSRTASMQSSDSHRNSDDCDRDVCSCCGFQFLAMSPPITIDSWDSKLALSLVSMPALFGYVSGFYHPPRS